MRVLSSKSMQDHPWWKSGIIYQIYPRSYKDSTGNGIGDLRGILSKLDYLKDLGITCIWLSPIYPSPMHDFGYDVSDYIDINEIFGSLEDFDALLEGIHNRGMKIMLDFVPNHTSSEHEWFQEAIKSKDNPYRDYYIWEDPAEDGSYPNNWVSFFGGPAWTYDQASDQYYMHQFVPEQPELNYENDNVKEGMIEFMKFWLDRGVDGFRLDVIFLLKKDQSFLDEPLNSDWDGVRPWQKTHRIYTSDVEGNLQLIKNYRELLDQYNDRVFLGEIYLPFSQLMKYYQEIQLPSNMILLEYPWEADVIIPKIREYFNSLPEGAWPNWQLGNHDNHRNITRIGRSQSKVAAMFLLTIKGTPIVYYGEEIGMENVEIPLDKIQDPPAVNEPEHADIIGRDPERTPMQWDRTENAGFSAPEIETWLPVGSNLDTVSVEVQENDPNSMLQYYKRIIELRNSHPALSVGDYEEYVTAYSDLFIYTRWDGSSRFLIVLNLSSNIYQLDLSPKFGSDAVILCDHQSIDPKSIDLSNVNLVGNDAILMELK